MGILCDGQGKKTTKNQQNKTWKKWRLKNCQQLARLSSYASTVGLCLQNLMIYLEF